MTEKSKKIALAIAKIIDEKKGKEIHILDIHGISSFTDYFVIAHGTSIRQVKALADEIEEQMIVQGIPLSHKEGYDSGKWILLDYVNVIVHLFLEEERNFYGIERVWKDGLQLDIDNI